MKKTNLTILYVLNSLSLIAIISFMFLTVNLKLENFRISREIEYLENKIGVQDNAIKIYKAELMLLTSPKSLRSLYKSYYNDQEITFKTNMAQIKNIEQLAHHFTVKKYSLNKY
jgi:hypothetical protein